MNRRSFVVASGWSALFASAISGVAQKATPEAEDEIPIITDFVHLGGVERAVYRSATITSAGLDTVMSDDLYLLNAWGFRFERASQASRAPQAMVTAYRRWATIGNEQRFVGLSEAIARTLGDESWGYVAQISGSGGEGGFYPWALFATRKESTTQVLVGASVSGSPLRRLADISENTIDRWPNSDRVTRENDYRIGALWDTLPRLDDLEEGVVIDYSTVCPIPRQTARTTGVIVRPVSGGVSGPLPVICPCIGSSPMHR
jgi:hypothetical protein